MGIVGEERGEIVFSQGSAQWKSLEVEPLPAPQWNLAPTASSAGPQGDLKRIAKIKRKGRTYSVDTKLGRTQVIEVPHEDSRFKAHAEHLFLFREGKLVAHAEYKYKVVRGRVVQTKETITAFDGNGKRVGKVVTDQKAVQVGAVSTSLEPLACGRAKIGSLLAFALLPQPLYAQEGTDPCAAAEGAWKSARNARVLLYGTATAASVTCFITGIPEACLEAEILWAEAQAARKVEEMLKEVYDDCVEAQEPKEEEPPPPSGGGGGGGSGDGETCVVEYEYDLETGEVTDAWVLYCH